MATSRSMPGTPRAGSLVTLTASLLLAWAPFALAGTPVTLDENAPAPKAAPADTSRKAAKTAVPAKRAPVTTVRSATAPAKPGAPSKPSAPATAAAQTARKPAAPPTTAARTAPASSQPGVARVAKAGVQASIPRVAPPPQSGAVARTAAPSPVRTPTVAPASGKVARVAPAPGTAAKVAAITPAVAARPVANAPSGPTLAKSGGTTVTAPGPKNASTASVTPLKPQTATKAAAVGAGVAVRMAAGSKGVGMPTKPGVAAGAALEDHVTYQYNALGRRDPFQSLMEGEYVGADVGGQAPPDLGGLKLVGVVWGSSDQFAMVEDARGDSYVLRRGDRVMNGYVEGLKRDAMIVNITVDGQSQSVTIPITRKGDKSNANR